MAINILYLSISMPFMDSDVSGFYPILLQELAKHDVMITIMCPMIADGFVGLREEGIFRVLRVPVSPFIGNYPMWQKGIRILGMSKKYKRAFKKYLKNDHFDVVVLATPPVSLYDVVRLVKRRTGVKTYLLLRDIHPECLNRKNISDYVMNNPNSYDECKKPYGINILIERLLHWQAQNLYKLSDKIGCMSPGNVSFMRRIAPYLKDNQLTLLPNWYSGKVVSKASMDDMRVKYDLQEKFVAIFGGTIGPAQAVWNIAALAKHNLSKNNVVFLVVGRGEKKAVLQEIAQKEGLTNIRFMEYLPHEDYERILELADVGLISIDEKYNVPTCPSKIIGYMAMAKPVLAMFNEGNDFGIYYIDNPKCGLWSTGLDNEKMFANFDRLYNDSSLRLSMGKNGNDYFKEHFTASHIAEELFSQIETL